MAAMFIRRFSLCTADCADGVHTPDFEVCERCGAHIHKEVFEVQTDSDRILVGSECFKDVMGYKWTAAHEKALEVAERVREIIQRRPGYTFARQINGRVAEFADSEGFSRFFRANLPHGLNRTVMRAGADLGLWYYVRERNIIEIDPA